MTRLALVFALLMPVSGAAYAGTLLPVEDAPEIPDDWRRHVDALVLENFAADSVSEDPLAAPIRVCLDTACAHNALVTPDLDEAGAVRALFTPLPDSPQRERAVLAQAVALHEVIVGARTGTWRDRAGNPRDDFEEEGQLDCISEAANTRSLLERLTASGLLRYHAVSGWAERYTFLLTHTAVEIIEQASGETWVVDSWPGANGEEPEIAPYLVWRFEWGA